jgi:predicted regulator of Ras-like GTPase activity (Roadblock/LC7/MglB family)
VTECEKRELLAWDSRSLAGCLHDFQRSTDVLCALIVKDNGAILAKIATDIKFDIDTLGVFSSMVFATSQMLVKELSTEGEVLGWITIGEDYHLLVMSITAKVALVTLGRKSFAKGLLEHQARGVAPRIFDCLTRLTTENEEC